jgi:AmiR/NasT family two-component response regulator
VVVAQYNQLWQIE